MISGDSGAEATSPVEYLAAPSAFPPKNRSTSPSPSCRSSLSHVTFVEDKAHNSDSEISHVRRQQTFKVGAEISWWDLFKAFFNRRVLTNKIEESIEIVQPDSEADKMYPNTRSPFDIEVHVVPKSNDTNDVKARCLLDTGCLAGNIISRELVEKLGYTSDDFKPLTYAEEEGMQTITGERLNFEAAILMTWRHDTMLGKYRDMRFLISPSPTPVEMLIGTRSILRWKMLAPPVLYGGNGKVIKPNPNKEAPVRDTILDAMRKDITELSRSVKTHEAELKKEEKSKGAPNKKYQQQLKDKIEKKQHQLTIKELERDAHIAHKAGNPVEEQRLKAEIEKEQSGRKAKSEERTKSKSAPKGGDAVSATNDRLAPTSAGARASTP